MLCVRLRYFWLICCKLLKKVEVIGKKIISIVIVILVFMLKFSYSISSGVRVKIGIV